MMVVRPMEDITVSKINNIENTLMSSQQEDMCISDQSNHAIPVFRTRSSQKHLKELLSLQLNLIEHQQLKITRKDKQILSLRSEKDQLEARLNRMERRLAVHKRNSIDTEESKVTKSSLRTPLTADKGKIVHVAPVPVTSKTSQPINSNGCLETNLSYLDYHHSTLGMVAQSFEEHCQTEYTDVSVPPWKVIVRDSAEIVDEDEDEDISNEAFEQRHMKPEIDEKRRKRWDLQQARQQEQHEILVQKYIERNKAPVLSKSSVNLDASLPVATLFKDAKDAMAINVGEIVPVCAFGYPLPALESKEMDLPWFDVDRRENQLRNAKMKVLKKLKIK